MDPNIQHTLRLSKPNMNCILGTAYKFHAIHEKCKNIESAHFFSAIISEFYYLIKFLKGNPLFLNIKFVARFCAL